MVTLSFKAKVFRIPTYIFNEQEFKFIGFNNAGNKREVFGSVYVQTQNFTGTWKKKIFHLFYEISVQENFMLP